jgi:hypothetical protein
MREDEMKQQPKWKVFRAGWNSAIEEIEKIIEGTDTAKDFKSKLNQIKVARR